MTWEQEANEILEFYISGGTILNGNLIGVDENHHTAIAIVVMVDPVTPTKVLEKYYYISKPIDIVNFYEMDRLPMRF